MKTIKLTEQEQSIIENALHVYLEESNKKLIDKNTKNIEKQILTKNNELTILVLKRIETL